MGKGPGPRKVASLQSSLGWSARHLNLEWEIYMFREFVQLSTTITSIPVQAISSIQQS